MMEKLIIIMEEEMEIYDQWNKKTAEQGTAVFKYMQLEKIHLS